MSLSPGKLFWVIFCTFSCVVTIFDVEKYSIAPHHFFIEVLGIAQRVPSLIKSTLQHISQFAVSHLEISLGSFWGILLCFWELLPTKYICAKFHEIISYEILYWCLLYYFHSHSTKKKFTARIPLLGALCNIFGSILGILFNVLRNLKHSLDNLHECLDITVVVTKPRNVLVFPLLWTFLDI